MHLLLATIDLTHVAAAAASLLHAMTEWPWIVS